jgi:hemerythrin-like metal-binding protein
MQELYMKWRPDFNLGIDEIDSQHKKIVELINVLNEAFMNNEAKEKLGSILNEMVSYADYHFKTEEKLFSQHNYPFTDEHKELHENFRQKVAQFKEQFDKGLPVTFRVLGFLRKWLTNHILDVDREYVDIVRSGEK